MYRYMNVGALGGQSHWITKKMELQEVHNKLCDMGAEKEVWSSATAVGSSNC